MQRYVLDVLGRDHQHVEARSPYVASPCWVTVEAMAAELAGGPPTRAQVESVRRATRTLERRGLAVVRCQHQPHRFRWSEGWRPGVNNPRTAAHLPLSVGSVSNGRDSQHLADLERSIAGALGRRYAGPAEGPQVVVSVAAVK
jgi:hypothetical protein